MRTRILLLLLFPFCISFSQTIDDERLNKFCDGDKDKCGPWDLVNDVKIISGDEIEKAPFNYILHIETNRNYYLKQTTGYGTVSFINKNTLITAKHLVVRKSFLENIKLSLSGKGDDKWIEFTKGEFEIIYYENRKLDKYQSDIAIIKILNEDKLRNLYQGHFNVAQLSKLSISKEKEINLTGYPCYFNDLGLKNDNLINKKIIYNKLNFSVKNIIAYRIFACSGDSGAPFWLEKDNDYKIVGIHHGGGGDVGLIDDSNISTEITDDVINWINKNTK